MSEKEGIAGEYTEDIGRYVWNSRIQFGCTGSQWNGIMTAMLDKIISRGPDDWGQYVDGHGGIGMRRLSITGVRNGKQPILNEDQTMALVFNGEIYNYKELRTALKKKGQIFSTETDSEVILHG